jgi:molybdate/tungstate transport system ATP-binding protein
VDRFLHMVARMHGTEAEVEEVVRRLGIESLLRRRSGLSTGQKQLVNLAAALLARPCAFLMDEPTSHLDWLNRKTFNDVVKALGMLVLYVTHDPFEAMYVADVICVMEGGRILRCVRERREELEQIYRVAESFWSPLR